MKKILAIILIILCLSGCGKIDPIDIETFQDTMTNHNINVVDITNEYENQDFILYAFDSTGEDKYKIQLIKATGIENAQVLFDINKETLEQTYQYVVAGTIHDINSKKFTLNSDEYYIYLRQVDDTLLYIVSRKEYKKEVNKIIKELGY